MKKSKRIIRKLISFLPQSTCEQLINLLSKRIHYPTIFLFHSVEDDAFEKYSVSKDYFNYVVSFLNNEGYEFLFENEYTKSSGKKVILSFDDGFSNNYLNAYPICKQANAKMSINIIADMIDRSEYLSKDQIKEMMESGLVQIQCHTKSHPILTDCDYEQLVNEIINSKGIIKEKIGLIVIALFIPKENQIYAQQKWSMRHINMLSEVLIICVNMS